MSKRFILVFAVLAMGLATWSASCVEQRKLPTAHSIIMPGDMTSSRIAVNKLGEYVIQLGNNGAWRTTGYTFDSLEEAKEWQAQLNAQYNKSQAREVILDIVPNTEIN